MALSRCHMSAFWPPGLILWLKRSYAPGFVISSCCFRRLLNWAKFWYRSVLNGPNIKRTPFIKRTPDYSLNEIDFVADRLEWFTLHITWNAHSYQFTLFIPHILNLIQLCFFFIAIWWKCSVKVVEFFVYVIVGSRNLNQDLTCGTDAWVSLR